MKRDQELISEAYNNLLLEGQVANRLNLLYTDYLAQEGLLDNLQQGVGKAYNAATGVVSDTAKSIVDITALPDKLVTYVNTDLPQYVDKLSEFIVTVLQSGAAGAVVTYTLGKLLMLFAKRVSRETQIDRQAIINMLPAEIQAQINKIEGLKQTNPAEYKKQVFQINKNALKQLERELVGTKKIQRDVIAKVFEFMGGLLSSGPGSIAGGIIIAIIMQKLGFNPMPIFPSL